MTYLYKEWVKFDRGFLSIIAVIIGGLYYFDLRSHYYFCNSSDTSWFCLGYGHIGRDALIVTLILLAVFNSSAWFEITGAEIKLHRYFLAKTFALNKQMRVFIGRKITFPMFGAVEYDSKKIKNVKNLLIHPAVYLTLRYTKNNPDTPCVVIEDGEKTYSLLTKDTEKVKRILDEQITKL